MLKFAKNFLFGAVIMGLGVGALLGGSAGIMQFFFWLSRGELWGLFAALATLVAIISGAGFAIHEAGKDNT